MRIRRGFMGLLVLVAGPVPGAESAMDAARRCAQVQDSLQRLVCYDRVFATPAAVLPAAVAAPAAAAPEPATSNFGDELVKRSVEERKRDSGPDTQTARVASTREVRPGAWRITLENEQVWQQTESDSHFFLDSGDTVVIKRGVLGGYQLEEEGGGRRVRVSRIK
jgi:hypothetical protein